MHVCNLVVAAAAVASAHFNACELHGVKKINSFWIVTYVQICVHVSVVEPTRTHICGGFIVCVGMCV